jgi:predicted nucleotidyltransferase
MVELGGPERQLIAALLRSDVAVSGRALGRITGMSQSRAQRALARLRASGLVLAQDAPPALLYRANHDHLAMPAVIELLSVRERLCDRIADAIAGWAIPPVAAMLYGSIARSDEDAGSDVDFLVVRPARLRPDDPVWEAQVAALSERVGRWTGRRASIVDMSRAEVRNGIVHGEPYLLAAAHEGIVVAGQPLPELGRRAG